MKVSPHTHCESPLTGSTIATMIKKAKKMGRTHFAYTDHGHLASALKAYGQAKKAGLKFIPGIEIYFKDTACPIIAGTPVERCKYFTATLYCQDQVAYQELCRIVSRTDIPTVEIRQEAQQLWSWKELEQAAKFNVNVVLSGVHCMVGKPMLAGRADLGEAILQNLRGIFQNRIYVAILCEPWVKRFSQVIKIDYRDGTCDKVLANDQVSTDKARRMKALDLIEREGHTIIKSISANMANKDVNKLIEKVTLHKGFLPLPGGDASLKVNRYLKALANRYQIPILATDYAYYADKEDKIVQTMRLEGNDKLHPNLHMKESQEIGQYLMNVLGMSPDNVADIFQANVDWASKFDNLVLKYDWRLATVDGDPLSKAMEIIKATGRMRWDNPMWVDRLREELKVIAKNPKKDLTAYFLPIRDVLNYYTENGRLVGPGRGSAGGSLFCYLLGITQIDPFKYDLPFNRFFSLDRIMMGELPDIDVDLEDRTLLVGEDGHSGYLYGRWGDKAAQISTRTTIRLKSAIKDTNRYFKGKVEPEIDVLSKGLPAPPQGISDLNFVFGFDDDEGNHHPGLIELSQELKDYSESRPKEWEIVSKAMGLTRAFSKHASAFVLSDVPIQDVVPTKDGNVTQYEAKECEAAGLIKYDFLVINQLKDIRVCLDLINKRNNEFKSGKSDDIVGWIHPESDGVGCADCYDPVKFVGEGGDGLVELVSRNYESEHKVICEKCKKELKNAKLNGHTVGYFTHKGKKTYIWDLPEEHEVFTSIWTGQTETVFQVNTKSMIPYVIDILPGNIMDIATILALVRPGPLDFIDENTGRNMTQEYVLRKRGQSEPEIKELLTLLPETFGVIAFQEQLTKIARDLAGFPGPEAETLRKHMSKKKMEALMKMKPSFMEGAKKKTTPEVAEKIWEQMVTFGRYGFSVIHAVEYGHITYACMFLKHYYPLEWWAAILTNATEQEITGKFWPYVKDIVTSPDINLSTDTMVVDYNNEKIRSKFGVIRGIGEATIEPIVNGRPYKDIQDFVNKAVAGSSLSHKLIHVGVLDSLFPAKTNLVEKLKIFEDAVEQRKFNEKAEKAAKEGKKLRITQPKQSSIPEQYSELHKYPLKDAAMKKSVLPSLPINMFDLGKRFSRVLAPYEINPIVLNSRGYRTILISGETLQRLDELPGESVQEDKYVASTCFVVKAEEFSYPKKNPTKRALKVILDADGYVSEKVLWPEYESGELVYPRDLKKGSIATFFFRKKAGRKDMSIMGVVVETSVNEPEKDIDTPVEPG